MKFLKYKVLSILLTSFFVPCQLFAQSFTGVFKSEKSQMPDILQVNEKGELLTGNIYRSDGSVDEIVARIQKGAFVGVLVSKSDTVEIKGSLEGKLLVFAANGYANHYFQRVSKDFNYDFSRLLGGVSNDLREKVLGVWILKEQYKIENGQKSFTELTGKEYMTAFNPDGKYVLDIRGFRDMEQKASKEINIPQEYRLKASDFFEMSQMMSWKLVGSSIHVFPTKAIPGVPTQVYSLEFQENKMILVNREFGYVEVYERKD